MEPSSNHNGNSDTVVKDLTNDARVSRNELGLVVENSEKDVDGASAVALVSPVANRSFDSDVKVRGELLEAKNGSVTIEPCLKGGDDVRVSGNETRSVALVSSVANVSGEKEVEVKSGTVMAEVQDLVSEVRVSGDETSSDALGSSVLLNGSELVGLKSGTVMAEVQDLVGGVRVSRNEKSSDVLDSSVLLNGNDVDGGNGVKIGAELVESKTETPKIKPSSGHDGGDGTVQGSVADAKVSRNEIGAVMENVDKVMDESSSDALTSSVPTSNGDMVTVEEKEGEYKVTDLVWAKVRNYPWWPAQIFDPSAANDKAKKHSNKKAHLIAYFGDQSFAWNKAPNIKHFRKNFGKMEKQGNSKAFHHAVNCALDEAYRRAEFGLACSCLSEEVVSKFKSQVFVNSGITEEASNIDGGDRFSTVANFKPVNAVMSLHNLAREDIGRVSRLEALSVKAQLLAYLRWKGYNQFSTQHLEGLDPEVQLMEEDKVVEDVNPASVSEKVLEDDKMDEDVKSGPVSEKAASKKRKLNARDSDGDSVPSKKNSSGKKEKSSKESSAVLKKKNNSGKKEKTSTNVIPTENPSSLKKEKKSEKKSGTKTTREDKGVKVENRNGKADQKATASSPKKLFKIGETICKVAKQLSESPTVPENESQKSEKRMKARNDTA